MYEISYCKKAKITHHDPVQGTWTTYVELEEARGGNHECELYQPQLFTRLYNWFTNRIVVKQIEVESEK